MPNQFIESHIRQLPKFATMPWQNLQWIAEAFQLMRVEPGEVIFAQGEETTGMYLFISGKAQLIRTDENGQSQVLGVVGTNQYLNEAALYSPGVETATLRVTEPAQVLYLSRTSLLNMLTHHPEIQEYLPVPVLSELEKTRRKEKVFQGQRDNEIVLLDTRRHWWAWARKTWLPIALMLVILIVNLGFVPTALALAIDGLSMVICGLWILYLYLEWRNDHVIITSDRVTRIERQILTFTTTINEIGLPSIQAVNADIITSDPFSRIMNFGQVELRTAGAAGNIVLSVIPNPEYVQDLIWDSRNKAFSQQDREHRNTIRATIDKALGQTNEDPNSDKELPKEATAAKPEVRQRSFGLWPTHFINEEGKAVYRKHAIFWFQKAFLPLLVVFGAIGFGIISTVVLNWGIIGLTIAAFVFVVGTLWLLWVDWDWRHDMYIVSDEMIELLHRRPLWLQEESDQVLLASVDNVFSDKSGLVQSVFNYGDVKISLLGGDRGDQKIFRSIPKPHVAQAEITRRQSRLRNKQSEKEERRRREELAEYLSVYHETMQTNQKQQPQDNASQENGRQPEREPASNDGVAPPVGVPRRPRRGMRPPNIPPSRPGE